jgi:hypothetical protein
LPEPHPIKEPPPAPRGLGSPRSASYFNFAKRSRNIPRGRHGRNWSGSSNVAAGATISADDVQSISHIPGLRRDA